MTLVDEDGQVLARASEPFEVGSFDLASARQGMRKMLVGMGGIGEDSPPAQHGCLDSDTAVGSLDP